MEERPLRHIPRRHNRRLVAAALGAKYEDLFTPDEEDEAYSGVIRAFAELLKAEGGRGARAQIVARALDIAGPPHN
jgi:hypothetical protein